MNIILTKFNQMKTKITNDLTLQEIATLRILVADKLRAERTKFNKLAEINKLRAMQTKLRLMHEDKIWE